MVRREFLIYIELLIIKRCNKYYVNVYMDLLIPPQEIYKIIDNAYFELLIMLATSFKGYNSKKYLLKEGAKMGMD